MTDFFTRELPQAVSAIAVNDVQQSMPVWAAAADQGDDVGLALALDAALTPPGPPEVRARLLLLAGRPDEAESVLEAQSDGFASGDRPTRWAEFLVLACRSARGDVAAHRGMLAAAAGAAQALPAWQIAYVVGAAADQHGDHETAAQAWSQLVVDHRIHTSLTIARFTAAQVKTRDKSKADAATGRVLSNALNFDATAAGTRAALEAVGLLEQRGDRAGARLLLRILIARHPQLPELAGAAARLEPLEAMRTYRLKALAAAVVVMAPFCAMGLVPLIAFWAGRLLWRRLVPVPGFDAVDSRVWHAARWKGQSAETRAKAQLGGLLGLAFGFCLSFPVLWILGQDVSPESSDLNPVVEGISLSTFMLLGLLTGMRLGRWTQVLVTRRQAARAAAETDRRAAVEARTCCCWQAASLRGSFAAAYLQRHLEPADNLTAAARSTVLSAAVLTCPTTGVLWLRVDAPTTPELIALRGMTPESPSSENFSTGQYL